MTPDRPPPGHRCHLGSRTPHTATCLRQPHDDGNDWAVLQVLDALRLRRQRTIDPASPSAGSPAAPIPEQHQAGTRPAPLAKTSTVPVSAWFLGLAALFCALAAVLSRPQPCSGVILAVADPHEPGDPAAPARTP